MSGFGAEAFLAPPALPTPRCRHDALNDVAHARRRVSLVLPNWHRVRLWSEALGRKVELVMTKDTLRCVAGLRRPSADLCPRQNIQCGGRVA